MVAVTPDVRVDWRRELREEETGFPGVGPSRSVISRLVLRACEVEVWVVKVLLFGGCDGLRMLRCGWVIGIGRSLLDLCRDAVVVVIEVIVVDCAEGLVVVVVAVAVEFWPSLSCECLIPRVLLLVEELREEEESCWCDCSLRIDLFSGDSGRRIEVGSDGRRRVRLFGEAVMMADGGNQM